MVSVAMNSERRLKRSPAGETQPPEDRVLAAQCLSSRSIRRTRHPTDCCTTNGLFYGDVPMAQFYPLTPAHQTLTGACLCRIMPRLFVNGWINGGFSYGCFRRSHRRIPG